MGGLEVSPPVSFSSALSFAMRSARWQDCFIGMRFRQPARRATSTSGWRFRSTAKHRRQGVPTTALELRQLGQGLAPLTPPTHHEGLRVSRGPSCLDPPLCSASATALRLDRRRERRPRGSGEAPALVTTVPAECYRQRGASGEDEHDSGDRQRHERVDLLCLESVAAGRHDAHTSVGRWHDAAIHRE